MRPFAICRRDNLNSSYQPGIKMKKRFILPALGLALTLFMVIPAAYAEEYTCSVSVGANTVDNLRVPSGATCILDGTSIKGTIKVETKATLRAYGVQVIGNVQAENAAQVEVLSGSTVGGSIQLKQGGGAYIDSVRINGDLQFEDNRQNLVASRNIIGGNLQAFQNSGGLLITGNTIDGNLQCKENRPAPTGGGNIVKGNREDQCANLRAGEIPRYTEDDLFGTWNTSSKSTMKIRRLGSRSTANGSMMVFNDDGTFALTEVESPQTYLYTGHWKIVKGNKLFLDLDIAGEAEFMRMWTNRLDEIAAVKGISLAGVNFSEIRFTLSQPNIPKSRLVPGKVTIKAKGLIRASANGRDIARKFNYRNRITFLNPL